MTKSECRMTKNHEARTTKAFASRVLDVRIGLLSLLVSPNLGENQMQFLCFKPERSSLRFQFRHCPNNHPKKMLGFARFLPASTDAFQKVLFGNCVIGFDVVSANTSAGPNELSDDSIGYRILWNRFRKIDDRFAKPGRCVLPNLNAFRSGSSRTSPAPSFQNESSVRASRLSISSFLRHSSFELRHLQ